MKKILYVIVFSLVTLTLASTVQAASASRATGGGYLDIEDGGIFAEATFVVTAGQTNALGCEATGTVVAIDHALGERSFGKVLYMVVEDNNAWVGIMITRATDPNSIGAEYVVQLQDNGEGAAATDMLGLASMPASAACGMPDMLIWLPWTYGNVTVN